MNRFVQFLKKDIAKPAAMIGQIGLEVLPTFVPASAPLDKIAASALAEVTHGKAALPLSATIAAPVSGLLSTALGGNMNQLEALALTIVFGTLQTVIKNPAHKALLQSQLIGLADSIYANYGMEVPAQPAKV